MDWLDSVAKAVSEGKTGSQFAIPDGGYIGDLFFITNKNNEILVALQWTGERWMHEHEIVTIQKDNTIIDKPTPNGLKQVSVRISNHNTDKADQQSNAKTQEQPKAVL